MARMPRSSWRADFVLDSGLLARLATRRQPRLLSPLQLEPGDPLAGIFGGDGVLVAMLPLWRGDQMIGALGAALPPPATTEVAALAVVAEQVGATIETHRLRRETYTQQQELAAIIDAMTDAVMLYDADGVITRMNTVARTWFGFDLRPEIAATPWRERFRSSAVRDGQGQPLPEQDWPQLRLLRGETIASADAVDIMSRTVDGREVIINITGAPVRDQDGQIVGAVTVMRDVRERRSQERRTQDALAALLAMTEAIVQAGSDGGSVHDAPVTCDRAASGRPGPRRAGL